MPSTELIVSIEQTGELPAGYLQAHLDVLYKLGCYMETMPDWAMQWFDQTDLSEDDLPDAIFIPGDEDFPASVYISAIELTDPEFRQDFILKINEQLHPTIDNLPLLRLILQTPHDDTR